MKQPLVIGFGRAGKRHDKLLRARGYLPAIVEPEIAQLPQDESRRHFFNLTSALEADEWEFAVICTPPDSHLQIIIDLDRYSPKLPVLCEKPLCAFGQLEIARSLRDCERPVMVAYNYRFNPDLENAQMYVDADRERLSRVVTFFASQYRENFPNWGILLDHVAHSLDILAWKFGALNVETARVYETPAKKVGLVFGTFCESGSSFKIHDEARGSPCDRVAWIDGGLERWEVTPNPQMFTRMYDQFFAAIQGQHPYWPGLREAYETQTYLEDANYFATEGTIRKVAND